MKDIGSADVKGKIVIVRVDINLPVKRGKPVVSRRIKTHSKTIKDISDRGAKVVVLSHQGRPKQPDLIPLKEHAKITSDLIGKQILFVSWDEDYTKAIEELTHGQVMFLDNTRFFDEETDTDKTPELHAEAEFIKKISKNADYFVLDALSIAHRNNASVVGFTPSLECFMGPELKKEIDALGMAQFSQSPRLLILGGSKMNDSIALMEHMFDENLIDEVLLGGVIGELFLKASGIEMGKKEEFLRSKIPDFEERVRQAKLLLEKFNGKIVLPVDVAIEMRGERKEIPVSELPSDYMTLDIGSKTSELFDSYVKKAKLIIYNGPLGKYEDERFIHGTKKIAESIKNSDAFSVLGGGDTENAIEKCGFSSEHFSHVSLAGKAALQFLSGKKLVGLEVLK